MILVRTAVIDGKMCYGLARPCNECVKMMKRFGIKKVIYTLDSPSGTILYKVEHLRNIKETYSTRCYRKYRHLYQTSN
jgi:deoxycytidylate deaminase